MKRIHYNILIICFALFSFMTTKAQNASSVKSAKTVELNALLKTKKCQSLILRDIFHITSQWLTHLSTHGLRAKK